MAVSNLIKDQSQDHVKRVAEFGMAAVKAAAEIPVDLDDPAKGFVEIRCGFHSGPVVANVVGCKCLSCRYLPTGISSSHPLPLLLRSVALNPRFGLFGDSVNVASRMESTSQPAKVHCSEASARLLMSQAPGIRLQKRGTTNIKGKGNMPTYFVLSNDKMGSSSSSSEC